MKLVSVQIHWLLEPLQAKMQPSFFTNFWKFRKGASQITNGKKNLKKTFLEKYFLKKKRKKSLKNFFLKNFEQNEKNWKLLEKKGVTIGGKVWPENRQNIDKTG